MAIDLRLFLLPVCSSSSSHLLNNPDLRCRICRIAAAAAEQLTPPHLDYSS